MTGIVSKVLKWLLVVFQLEVTGSAEGLTEILQSLSKIERSRGRTGLIIYCKAVRLHLNRFLSGSPVTVSTVIRLTGDGIPVILGPFIPKIRHDKISTDTVRVLLTIFSSTRALSLGKDIDIDSIIRASR